MLQPPDMEIETGHVSELDHGRVGLAFNIPTRMGFVARDIRLQPRGNLGRLSRWRGICARFRHAGSMGEVQGRGIS